MAACSPCPNPSGKRPRQRPSGTSPAATAADAAAMAAAVVLSAAAAAASAVAGWMDGKSAVVWVADVQTPSIAKTVAAAAFAAA